METCTRGQLGLRQAMTGKNTTRDVVLEPIEPWPQHRVARPVMRQTWKDLTFLHWPYEPSTVRELVPQELTLDLFEGRAWIGLVPFNIEDLTAPRAPGIPWISHFPETNLRTYVADARGSRGIWFFSLEAARLLAVLGARATYGLPYFWARMTVSPKESSVSYRSCRLVGHRADTDLEVKIGVPISQPTEFDLFLTARFRLYAHRRKRLLEAQVEHQPWQLRRAELLRSDQNLMQAAGLPAAYGDPVVHFSGKVDVLVGRPSHI